MKNIQINIFDTNFVWKGAIDNIQSFVFRNSWHEIVNSELVVSRTAQGAEELAIGRFIIINNDFKKALIIEDMNANIADDNWSINLVSLKGLLNYRIAHPTDSGSFTAQKQAEVMMLLASKNLVTQGRDSNRKFLSVDGQINRFSIASLKTYGDSVDLTVDWDTGLLGDSIVEVSKMFDDVAGKYPIGWNVFVKSTLDGFQMDTYQTTNRSIRQAINSPVVFSEDFNNIKDANYSISMRDWVNFAYINWNDGTNDQNTTVGNAKHGATTGFNRKEIILDSSLEKSSEVIAEGRAELNKRPKVENFTAEILDNPNTMSSYEIDWFLGDIVTLQTKSIKKDTTISVDTQVIQTEEIYDQGEYSLSATFGEAKLSIIKKIKQAITQRK
jgi:Siphovirus ReqiPepy6 Gp37-like protein